MRLYLRSSDRRPDPPPLRTNDRAVVRFGITVWAVLFMIALAMRSRLVEQGRDWWIWTPLAAIALGFYGLYYLRQRERHRTDRLATQPSQIPAAPLERACDPVERTEDFLGDEPAQGTRIR